MSFNERKSHVEEGDTVMLYLGKQQLSSIVIDSKKTHQTIFGAFPHKDLVGRKFGTKVKSKNGKGWLFILHPTPELWTVTLPHRTQILYTTDISLITLELDLKPGSIVVESGTGSGSLSHAIIRTIKPNGHLHTFDFHQQRVEKATEEFKCHGLEEYVTVKCADACKDGFEIEDKADAVFLDLPAPYDAIAHAKKALKKSGGRICSFSPCIEQVQRTCIVLRQHRFCEIKTVECLLRPMNVRTVAFPQPNLGPKTLEEFRNMQHRNRENARKDRGNNRQDRENSPQDKVLCEPENKKKKSCDEDTKDNEKPDMKEHDQSASSDRLNQPITDQSASSDRLNQPITDQSASSDRLNQPITDQSASSDRLNQPITGVSASGFVSKLIAKEKPSHTNMLTSKPGKEIPGHTGYLTFASLYPEFSVK